jgi:hypothetical protein
MANRRNGGRSGAFARAFASVLTIDDPATQNLAQFLDRLIGKMQKAPFGV